MARFDDDEIFDESMIEEEENPYLTSSNKAMRLISQLLPKRHKTDAAERAARYLDDMLDRQIMSTLSELNLSNALDLSQQFMKLSDQIMEYQKIKLLAGKTIIGIGGQFSAGKSCFINSLLQTGDNEIQLPEDQTPTTSIPTYIVNGQSQEIFAYIKNNRIKLDVNAMQAMTHRFYDEYQIGFSRFVSNLVIHTPTFPKLLSNKAVILDTPGYSKADNATKESLSDEHIASKHLKAADFLIWLIDIDNGIIKDNDINFILGLEFKTPILIVFNKADKKLPSDCQRIVDDTAEYLQQSGLNIFGVTAYSSRNGEESFNAHYIEDFMKTVVNYSNQKQDVKKTLNQLINSIEKQFNDSINESRKQKFNLSDSIYKAEDILSIKSLVLLHNQKIKRINKLYGDLNSFKRIRNNIMSNFKVLTEDS